MDTVVSLLAFWGCPLPGTTSTFWLSCAGINLFLELYVINLRCSVNIWFGLFRFLETACVDNWTSTVMLFILIQFGLSTTTWSILAKSRIALRGTSWLRHQNFCSVWHSTKSFSALYNVTFHCCLLHNDLVRQNSVFHILFRLWNVQHVISNYWTFNFSSWWWVWLEFLFLDSIRALTLSSNTVDLGVGRFIINNRLFERRCRWNCLFRRGVRLVSLLIEDWLEANEFWFL